MLTLTPLHTKPVAEKFNVVKMVEMKLRRKLKEGDVLVISSKFLAISEGRVVKLKGVVPGDKAKGLAARYRMDPRLCELVIRESDEVIGGVPGFLLTVKEGLLTPNAGIDKSNIKHGMVVLYPQRPQSLALMIRRGLEFSLGVDVAVVVCDSRLMPMRRGTTGVAIASSGLESILDLRGKRDLFGNVLKVTSQAIADDLSSAAQLLMGESDEATPVVLVRGLNEKLMRDVEYPSAKFSISADECVYLRSLGYKGQTVPTSRLF
ncbi:MAG: coenzyme F420-0:L-glutamate ligase [Nitrososphaerota archaeon]|nr:coenzyme F420-0:L-glutamate ligase [Nitrososphaerota archaeon]